MSKWQDAGFPDNLHLANPRVVLNGFIEALAERMGDSEKIKQLEQQYQYESLNIDRMIARALITNYLVSPDGSMWTAPWSYHYGIPDGIIDDVLEHICQDILNVKYVKEQRFSNKFDVEWARCRYHIINAITAPSLLYFYANSLELDDDGLDEDWTIHPTAGEPQNAFFTNFLSAETDDYYFAKKAAIKVVDGMYPYNFVVSRPDRFIFDIDFEMISTKIPHPETDPVIYNSFNSGWNLGAIKKHIIRGCESPAYWDITNHERCFFIVFSDKFSLPHISSGNVGMRILFQEMQKKSFPFGEDEKHLYCDSFYFRTDARPYLEYYDPPES